MKGGLRALPFSSQHLQIFIHRRSAEPANSRQFTDIHLPIHQGRIMPQEVGGDIVLGCFRSADPPPFGFCVCHP